MTALHLSFGELHFHTCRAVFGAGLPWGLAEDAASTAAWLTRCHVDPAPALARMLTDLQQGRSSATPLLFPADGAPVLQAASGSRLSALVAGPSAADWWEVLSAEPGPRLTVQDVDAPGWVTATVAQRTGLAGAASVRRMMDQPPGDLRVDAALRAMPGADAVAPPQVVTVAADAWSVVHDFFRQSLVPSTDASRQAGAGAGLVDRD